MEQTQILYRYFDKDDNLLYVGISSNYQARAASHAKFSKWSHLASYVRLEHFPNRQSVLDAEKFAIISEKPIYNIIHNQQAVTSENHWLDLISFSLTDNWHSKINESVKIYQATLSSWFNNEINPEVLAAFAIRGSFIEHGNHGPKSDFDYAFVEDCEQCNELNKAEFFEELNIRYWGRLKGAIRERDK